MGATGGDGAGGELADLRGLLKERAPVASQETLQAIRRRARRRQHRHLVALSLASLLAAAGATTAAVAEAVIPTSRAAISASPALIAPGKSASTRREQSDSIQARPARRPPAAPASGSARPGPASASAGGASGVAGAAGRPAASARRSAAAEGGSGVTPPGTGLGVLCPVSASGGAASAAGGAPAVCGGCQGGSWTTLFVHDGPGGTTVRTFLVTAPSSEPSGSSGTACGASASRRLATSTLVVEVSDPGAVATYTLPVAQPAAVQRAQPALEQLAVQLAGAGEHSPMLVAIAEVSSSVRSVTAALPGASSDTMVPVRGWAVLAVPTTSASREQRLIVRAVGEHGVLVTSSISHEPFEQTSEVPAGGS